VGVRNFVGVQNLLTSLSTSSSRHLIEIMAAD
jgi:hypothetical protein